MARMARVVLPGYPHHVTQRGNRRQKVFFSNADYFRYIQWMAEACKKTGTRVLAYCLMPNHVHMILVPVEEDGLRATLGEAHRRYTCRINSRNGWQGHLWQERFHSVPMDQQHLLAAVRYVELNPVRANLAQTATDWQWSSARAHTDGQDDVLVAVEPLLELIPDWSEYLNEGDSAEMMKTVRLHTRTGRPMGNPAFMGQAEKLTGRVLVNKRKR